MSIKKVLPRKVEIMTNIGDRKKNKFGFFFKHLNAKLKINFSIIAIKN